MVQWKNVNSCLRSDLQISAGAGNCRCCNPGISRCQRRITQITALIIGLFCGRVDGLWSNCLNKPRDDGRVHTLTLSSPAPGSGQWTCRSPSRWSSWCPTWSPRRATASGSSPTTTWGRGRAPPPWGSPPNPTVIIQFFTAIRDKHIPSTYWLDVVLVQMYFDRTEFNRRDCCVEKRSKRAVTPCAPCSSGSQPGGVPPSRRPVPHLGPGELGAAGSSQRPRPGLPAAVDREPVRQRTGQPPPAYIQCVYQDPFEART